MPLPFALHAPVRAKEVSTQGVPLRPLSSPSLGTHHRSALIKEHWPIQRRPNTSPPIGRPHSPDPDIASVSSSTTKFRLRIPSTRGSRRVGVARCCADTCDCLLCSDDNDDNASRASRRSQATLGEKIYVHQFRNLKVYLLQIPDRCGMISSSYGTVTGKTFVHKVDPGSECKAREADITK